MKANTGNSVRATERKNTEEALRASEQRWETTLSSIGDAVITADLKGNVTFLNGVAEGLTGWTSKETLGKPLAEIFNIINEETRRKCKNPVSRVLKEGKVVGLANHTILVRKNGAEVPIDDSGAPIRDKQGNIAGVVLVFRDITERKKMEKELFSLAKFPSENPYMVFRIGKNGVVLYANRESQRLPKRIRLQVGQKVSDSWLKRVTESLSNKRRLDFEEAAGNRFFLFKTAPILAEGYVNFYGTDITERKKAEVALQESLDREHLLADLVRSASVALAVGYPDGKIGMVNQAFEKLTGYTKEELSKISWNQTLTPPEYIEFEMGKLSEINLTKKSVRYEKEYIRKDGSRVPVELVVHPFLDKKGDVTHYFAFINDISERKKAEEALATSEKNYSLLFSNMTNGFAYCEMLFDKKGKPDDFIYLQINGMFEKITGLKRETVIGRKVTDAIPGIKEATPELFDIYGRVAQTGKPEKFEINFTPLHMWLSISVYSPQKNHFAAVFEDITERKKTEEALRESESTLQNIIDGSPAFIFLKDKDGRFITINKLLENSLGMRREELRGKTDYDIFPKEVADYYRKADRQVLETKQPIQTEEIFDSPDGKKYTLLANKFPLFNSSGEVIATCGISLDITERKKAEEAINRQRLLQQGANRILEAALKVTRNELGEVCLSVAEELTESKFGFIGDINPNGLSDIAISNPGWDACNIITAGGHRRPPGNFKIHGIYGRVLSDGKSLFTNDPAQHPDSIGLPQGHPPIKSFLGVPLKSGDKTIGMIAVANRERGFTSVELECLEALAPTIVEAFARKKAEEALWVAKEQEELSRKKMETILETSPSAVVILDAPDGKFSYANKRARQLYGFDTLGLDLAENVAKVKAKRADGTDYPIKDMPVTRTLTSGVEVHNAEMIIERADGYAFPIMASTAPLHDLKGNITAAIVVFEDITDRKKAEEALAESEERWSTTLSSIGDAVIATDVEGHITFMNKVAQVLTGYSLAEAAQKPLQEIFHILNEETRSEVENPVTKVLKYGAIIGLANHSVLIGRFGKEVPIDDSGSPIRDQDGQVTGVVLVFHDISERKKTEAQLERQAELISIDPDAVMVRKPDGTITFWSKGAEKLYGYTEQEALGQIVHKLLATKFPADFGVEEIFNQIMTSGDWSGELIHRTKEGREVIVQSHWVSRKGENNELEFLESNVDVTDRRLLQERLEDKAAEVEEYATRMEELVEERTHAVKKQASLIDLSPDAIMVRGLDGCISFWSRGAEKLYGWTAKEAIGQVSSALLKTIFPMSPIEIDAQIRVAGSWSGELRHKTKDGSEVIVESRWLAEKNKAGQILDILESNFDITERKKAEAAVLTERKRLFDVLETMPAMVCLITPDYHIAFANRRFRERFGESKGRPCYEYCFGQPEPCKFCESLVPLKTGKPHQWEVTGPDGSVIEAHDYPFTDVDGKQLVLEMDLDITARKKAEAQAAESARKLKDAERLAAIGATAGMMGHDIRNPLQAITGDVYLAKSELDGLADSEEKKAILDCLEETERNIDYINKIVADLQDFARPLNPRAQESDLKAIVEDTIAKQKLSKEYTVKINVKEDARKISADPDYLKRIISNLVLNAVQAMPTGGKLTVRADRDEKSTDIIFEVQDTGVGIPDEVKDKLFTPMFTTKSKGQGFGLAVVKRMTETLGGTVTFESEHGKGTTFILRLPPLPKNKG